MAAISPCPVDLSDTRSASTATTRLVARSEGRGCLARRSRLHCPAMRLVRIVHLLATSLSIGLLAIGCSSPPPAPASNVVILGLDAATWDVLDPLMQRGLLPNLQKLVRPRAPRAPLQVDPAEQLAGHLDEHRHRQDPRETRNHGRSFVSDRRGRQAEPGVAHAAPRQGALEHSRRARLRRRHRRVVRDVAGGGGQRPHVSDRAHWGA